MKASLDRLAEQAPAARLSSHELWRAGRVRRKRRQWRKAALSLLALALAAPVVGGLGTTQPPPGSRPPDPAVPQTIAAPHFWQRSFAGAPNGPAMAVFRARNGTAVLGRDGSYRLHDGLGEGLLSPSGDYVAGVDDKLLDLRTGRETDLPRLSRVLAWSRDGSVFVFVSPDGLAGYEVATGEIRGIVNEPVDVRAAALSPDGTRLAYTVLVPGWNRDHLTIFDLAQGSPIVSVELERGHHLGNQAGWSPDGGSVLLVDAPAPFAWRIRSFDMDSQQLTEVIPPQQGDAVQQVAGWQDGRPLLTVLTDHETVELRRYNDDGSFTTLASVETYSLQIPVDVIAEGRFGGAPARAPLFEPDRWVFYVLAAMVIAGVLTLLIVRRRRRRGDQAAPGMPTGQDMPLGPMPQ